MIFNTIDAYGPFIPSLVAEMPNQAFCMVAINMGSMSVGTAAILLTPDSHALWL